MIGKQLKQINNLRLTLAIDGIYRVYNPSGSCLEEFAHRRDAEAWMEKTPDFLQKGKRGYYDQTDCL
jgi:hypothetical protein